MKARIIAMLLVLCGLVGPEVCGAFCAVTASAAEPVAIETALPSSEHTAPCHGSADPERTPDSQPLGADPSGSEEMDCCDESAGIVNLGPAGELQTRPPVYAAALLTAASQPPTPNRVPLDTGPGPGPGSPYRSVNPPLLN